MLTHKTPLTNVLLLVSALLALLAAMWAGLLRIGWGWPVLQPMLPMSHGPLMVSGFFGTLISLERAVALKRRWPYLGPALSGLGGLLLLFGVPGAAGPLLLTLGSLGLAAVFLVILRMHRAMYTATMAAGALCWLVGNVLWLSGWPIYHIVLWWMGFLVLTIAGERLELGRVMRPPRASLMLYPAQWFAISVTVFLLGLVVMLPAYDPGVRLAGAGILALAVWLGRYDVARRTVRQSGLPRYIALCLLAGYAWLGVGGLTALVYGAAPAGPIYDALLHSVMVGFVFGMVFGHAPIIFPAVLNLPVVYRPLFYAPLIVLQASLALRIAGDLLLWQMMRQWGGLLNVVAILLFLGVMFSGRWFAKTDESN